MTFLRVKELEEQVTQLRKELNAEKLERLAMQHFIKEQGLLEAYDKSGDFLLGDHFAEDARSKFEVMKGRDE